MSNEQVVNIDGVQYTKILGKQGASCYSCVALGNNELCDKFYYECQPSNAYFHLKKGINAKQ